MKVGELFRKLDESFRGDGFHRSLRPVFLLKAVFGEVSRSMVRSAGGAPTGAELVHLTNVARFLRPFDGSPFSARELLRACEFVLAACVGSGGVQTVFAHEAAILERPRLLTAMLRATVVIDTPKLTRLFAATILHDSDARTFARGGSDVLPFENANAQRMQMVINARFVVEVVKAEQRLAQKERVQRVAEERMVLMYDTLEQLDGVARSSRLTEERRAEYAAQRRSVARFPPERLAAAATELVAARRELEVIRAQQAASKERRGYK